MTHSSQARSYSVVCLAAACALVIGCAAQATVSTQPPMTQTSPEPVSWDASSELEVHFLDVGQGDAAVIITPEGRVVLIDGGPPDCADDLVAELLDLGVTEIDLLLVSHAHADHIGGLYDVLHEFPVARYADPGFPHTSRVYGVLLGRLIALQVPRFELSAGQVVAIEDGITLYVIGPETPFIGGSRSDVNANSLVVLLQHGDNRILFMGDAEHETEMRILGGGWAQDVDVLKVAHHGSEYASTESFLEAVQPEFAVISCGADNSYGHPAEPTLDRLRTVAPAGIYRTDLDGTIRLFSDGASIRVSEPSPSRDMLE